VKFSVDVNGWLGYRMP